MNIGILKPDVYVLHTWKNENKLFIKLSREKLYNSNILLLFSQIFKLKFEDCI